MIDPDILSHLRSQPLEALVRTLQQLHRARAEGSLPAALRATAHVESAKTPIERWLALLQPERNPAQPSPEQHVRQPEPPTAPLSPAANPPASDPPASAELNLASIIRAVLTEYEGLLRRYNEDFDLLVARTSSAPGESAGASLGAEADPASIVERLQRAQLLFLKFPIAAQAAFAAFVEEGRRYGKTLEGQRWQQALEGSPLLKQVRDILSSLSMGALRENPSTVLPSSIVDLLVSAASRGDVDALIAKAFRPGGTP